MSLERSEVVRAVIMRTYKELKRDNEMIIRYNDKLLMQQLLLIKNKQLSDYLRNKPYFDFMIHLSRLKEMVIYSLDRIIILYNFHSYHSQAKLKCHQKGC